MVALAHIYFLMVSSIWAGPKSQACIEGLLMEAFAAAPVSVVSLEAGPNRMVFRLDRGGQVVLTHTRGKQSFNPVRLAKLPKAMPGESIQVLRALALNKKTVELFAWTNYERLFQVEIYLPNGGAYINHWRYTAKDVSPLFQPISHNTLVELGEESGTISLRHAGKPAWLGELKMIPRSFVAFTEPNLSLWVVGTRETSDGKNQVRALYSWSQAKDTQKGRARALHPSSLESREIPVSIEGAGNGTREGVVLKAVVAKGQGEDRENIYRIHRHYHSRWSCLGNPDGLNVRPVHELTKAILRGAAAAERIKIAFHDAGITEPDALEVARQLLSSEQDDGDFPELFSPDYELLAAAFATRSEEVMASMQKLDLRANPSPFGAKNATPDAWREWVALKSVHGLHSLYPQNNNLTGIRKLLRDEIQRFPAYADFPFWGLLYLTLEKLRIEQDYKESW